MQDWDRLVIILVGAVVSIYAGIDGYKLWKRERWLGVAGVALLIVGAIGVPVLLALLS